MTTPTTRSTRRSSGRRVAVTLAATVAIGVAAGCTRVPEQGGGPGTTGPAATGPITTSPSGGPVAAGERRPEPASSLVRATSCENFAEAVRPRALAFFRDGGFVGSGADDAAIRPMETARSAAPSVASGAAAVPQAGVDFSATNVQEAGVDEPDRVKTNGRLLITSLDERLRVLDVTGPPRLVATLDLPNGGGSLLLAGDRALVLGGQAIYGPAVDAVAGQPFRPRTTVTVVDLKDPAHPTVARTHTIDGTYVDARMVGGVARIVTRSQPNLGLPQPTSGTAVPGATADRAAAVRQASPAAFLPVGASCTDAYVPTGSSGIGSIAVQSLDPAANAPGPAVTVVADGSTVYASATRLFVATTSFANGGGGPVPVLGGPPAAGKTTAAPIEAGRTAIHAFDITDPAKARYAGSGDAPGRLLNQFSMSEDAGVLRVATTLDGQGFGGDPGRGTSESRVTILRPAGTEWVETGAVGGLGRGERIYAVRFLGTTGYVVTFRQVDPLYVLDLRDPRSPKLTGELKITGYSAYLHPAGDRRLLGIGQEASEQGRRQGTQLSLFDVGDPAAPAKLGGAVLTQATSTAESDHHAFLFWPATGLVVAPVTSYGGRVSPAGSAVPDSSFVGAVAFKVGDKTVAERARITHPGATPIERSLVTGGRLLTVSRVGVAMNDVNSLADGGFLPFR